MLALRRVHPLCALASRSLSAASRSHATSAAAASNIINGTTISKTIREELTVESARIKRDLGVHPGLAVILVGARTDSATYVRAKKRACQEIGIQDLGVDYEADVSQDELTRKIRQLNADASVHGILVQLPLPPHLDEAAVLHEIAPHKDVDGLHPLNTAALCSTQTHAAGGRNWEDMTSIDFPISCTPQGCIELLDRSGVEIKGKKAAVIGRSNIVGIPMAMLLMQRNATVTIVHSRTVDAPSVVRDADIVVAAVGRSEMVTADWIKPGATVIDVGINSKKDDTRPKGYRLVGDVDYEDVAKVAGKITPVPGGVGPLTIAMLMRNVIGAATRSALKGTDPQWDSASPAGPGLAGGLEGVPSTSA